jgi:cytidylate kinase
MSIITISRGTKSGGRAVAECLAATLNCPYVGREIIQSAAAKLGVTEETLKTAFLSPPEDQADLIEQRRTYLLSVQAALAELCAKGKLVYHGLAGQFLIRKDLPGVLRVRLIAPLEVRVQALRESKPDLTQDAAEDYICKVDEERRHWCRVMYDADVEDASLYDVTINLQFISRDSACAIIAELAAQPQYRMTGENKAKLEAFAAECRAQLSEGATGTG